MTVEGTRRRRGRKREAGTGQLRMGEGRGKPMYVVAGRRGKRRRRAGAWNLRKGERSRDAASELEMGGGGGAEPRHYNLG